VRATHVPDTADGYACTEDHRVEQLRRALSYHSRWDAVRESRPPGSCAMGATQQLGFLPRKAFQESSTKYKNAQNSITARLTEN